MKKLMRLALASSSLFAFVCPAGAATFNGLEYTLTGQYTDASHSAATFNLSITGINGANDTEGGRYGLNAFAFSLPQGFSTASAPGFTLEIGGLNSSGCNGAGNFFCFNANAPKPSTTLAANSSLEFEFSVALLAGYNFDNYDSHFKVDWLGSLNNYNLISQQLSISGGVIDPQISTVPVPPAIVLFASGLAGLGALSWRKRRKQQFVATEASTGAA